MSTVRLYQTRSYDTRFTTDVVELEPMRDDQAWVLLRETLFYPEAGGQPHDVGRLGEARVVDVQNRDDEVWHLLEGALPAESTEIEGWVDWERRYRHMQRHSGQHLLSQAFLRVSSAFETRSVNLSNPVCTIDFAGEPTEEAPKQAERLVNEAVYANYAVQAFEVSEQEITRYPLRRPPKVRGTIRLVQMGDWELSACGGTHVARTGEAGPIKLLRAERVKGELTRVHFVCGWEALEDYALKHQVSYGLAVSFSAQVPEVPERVEALKGELANTKRRVSELQEQLAQVTAQSLLKQAEPGNSRRIVTHVLEPQEAGLLKPLGQALAEEPDVVALLAERAAGRVNMFFIRGAAIDADMGTLLRSVLPIIDGKGGGKPDLAQGSGSRPEGAEKALEQARRAIAR